jgi:hypothetical protein
MQPSTHQQEDLEIQTGRDLLSQMKHVFRPDNDPQLKVVAEPSVPQSLEVSVHLSPKHNLQETPSNLLPDRPSSIKE